jgi:putative DNA primase/helicase
MMITLAELSGRPIWVGWRTEIRDGRPTKVPYDPVGGRKARANDPATWATHDKAARWAATNRGDGVGIELSNIGDTSLGGVDLDTCRDKDTGAVEPWAEEVISRFDSYAEVSPSRTGIKIFFAIDNEDMPAVSALLPGGHGRSFKNGSGEHPPAIELYIGLRYFAVTYESVGATEELRTVSPADLRWLILEAGPKFVGNGKVHVGNGEDKSRDGSRSAKAFRAGAALKAEGKSYAEMRDALLAHKDSDIAKWARTKGRANGEREMRRIFDKATSPGNVIDPRAPYDNAKLFQAGLATPVHYHRGGFHEWSGCAWPEVDEASLRARLYTFLDRAQSKSVKGALLPVKPNALMVGGVLDALRAAGYLDCAIAPPAWLGDSGAPANEVIACANGLLHLPTRRLLPHTPSFFNLNALDYAYDPNAATPEHFLAFLRQLWPADPESIATLQQIFGYLLTSDTSQQKAFLFVGPKRSGKGTVGRVLARLVGQHNCAAPTLASLGERFGLASLIGKTIAIISDARLSGRADQQVIVERLLSITGEDGQTIDRKYNPCPWEGTLPTRFVVLTNELPKLGDSSGALASRFILLRMTESFYGREDHGLTDRLLTELPGILNWALDGWAELKRAGYFKQPASAQQAMEQLEDLASPVGAFVRERCDVGAAFTNSIGGIFDAWVEWCAVQHRDHPGTVQSFGRDLAAAVPGLTKARLGHRGEQVSVYQGLRLKRGEW